MKNNQVVITGMGVISVLGNTLEEYWAGLVAGRSGISRITQFDPSAYPCQIGGEVKDFDPGLYTDRKEARRMARSSQFAVAAAVQAVADAGLPEKMPNPERAGVVFGTAIGGLERITDGIEAMKAGGYTKVNPFVLPSGLPNMPAFVIAFQLQCLGPNSTVATACATSTQTIGEGSELIRRGAADVVIVGGVEALIRNFAWAGFCAMRAMPVNYNDRPEAASRPFNIDREGFVYSEGAGALILESADHARAREARIYAEVLGHSSSADAFHMAAIDPSGNGAIRAMRWALANAGVQPEEVDYINTHGSSTPLNDVMETNAIKTVFGEEYAYKMAISSTKSMIGHALGATGALEAIACVKAIETGCIPPTINYENPDPECDLDYVPNVARKRTVDVALSNSFGLGGQNACVVLGKYGENK
ncbi:MAG TPA: beta-ketoacyl-ACP synthase II [Anaerolineales bacterium]|nr:beta-ketoacyl-ACP synthase II [Anaerolineales bacterium]